MLGCTHPTRGSKIVPRFHFNYSTSYSTVRNTSEGRLGRMNLGVSFSSRGRISLTTAVPTHSFIYLQEPEPRSNTGNNAYAIGEVNFTTTKKVQNNTTSRSCSSGGGSRSSSKVQVHEQQQHQHEHTLSPVVVDLGLSV